MAAGIFRRRQRAPNQPLRVNASHPLASGLGLFGWAVGVNRVWNALTGKVIDLSTAGSATGTFTRGAGDNGPTLRMAGGERGGGTIYNPTSATLGQGTLVARFKPAQATGGITRPYVLVSNGTLDRGLLLGMAGATSSHAWGVSSSNGWLLPGGSGVDEQVWRTVGVNRTPGVSASVLGWLDGVNSGSAGHTGADVAPDVPTRVWFGRDPTNYFGYPTGDVGWFGYWHRVLSAAEHRLLHEEAWSLVAPASLVQGWRFAVAAGGDTALAGAATGAGTASGALTTAIRLAASPGGTGTAAAALTTGGAALAAAATGSGTAAGALTTGIALAGAGTGSGVATGSLTTAVALAGAATGSGTASAALTTAIQLAAAATGAGAVAANLTAGSTGLVGAATGSGTAAGALTTAIRLGAVATGTGTAAGALTTTIRLAAAAVASGAAAGSLTTGIALSAAPVGAGTAAGALTTAIRLAAAAVGSGIATGRLIADVPPAVTPLRTIRLRAPRALALPPPAMPALPKPRRLVA